MTERKASSAAVFAALCVVAAVAIAAVIYRGARPSIEPAMLPSEMNSITRRSPAAPATDLLQLTKK